MKKNKTLSLLLINVSCAIVLFAGVNNESVKHEQKEIQSHKLESGKVNSSVDLKKLPIKNGKYSKFSPEEYAEFQPNEMPQNTYQGPPKENNFDMQKNFKKPPEEILNRNIHKKNIKRINIENNKSKNNNMLALELIKKLQLDPEEVSKKEDVVEKKRLSKIYQFLLPDPIKMIKIGNKINLYCLYSPLTLDWNEIKDIMDSNNKSAENNLQKFFKLKKEKMIKVSIGDTYGTWKVTQITNHSITYVSEELFKTITKYY